ncbi:MAG: hypothetical protein HY303_09570 [Candidatus Wallbacteria bacterium]|nr:hypothetical protein [Candidatus Wallbacteria bacterium]
MPIAPPNPLPADTEPAEDAQSPFHVSRSSAGIRPENHEKARLWGLDHPRRRPEGHDRETWLAAVKGWLNAL